MRTKHQLYWLVVLATLVRCIVAVSTELGNDEVYYLTYAHHLQWNYFDHPPMVALLIRLTTFNLLLTNEFFVRLGPILLTAVNTFLVFRITAKLKNKEAGLLAALLFTASPYCSIIAGTFILPDSPQLFFYILAVKLLLDICTETNAQKAQHIKLLLFGFISGLCIMSKVHGVFLWAGFGGYIIFHKRDLLKRSSLYFAAMITAAVVSPILLWNIQNHFVTYNFHSNRVIAESGFHLDSFIRELLGGILYNNPLNYLLYILTGITFLNNKKLLKTTTVKLLLWLALPLVFLLLGISLFRDTLPHWSGPAYISCIILAALYIPSSVYLLGFLKQRVIKLALAANGLLLVILAAGLLAVNFYPGTTGKKETELLGDGDVTLDMFGWEKTAAAFNRLYHQNKKEHITQTTFIISNKWFPGAHIDNYIAQPLGLDFIAIGDTNDIHTYAWLNNYRKKLHTGDDAYFITSSSNFQSPYEKYNKLFTTISKPYILPITRNGKPAKNIFVYLMKGYRQK